MDTEKGRLATFKDWSPRFHVQPSDLVQAGLFYVGPGDRVKCFSCHLKLGDWEPGDCPLKAHKEHSRECEFLSNLPVQLERADGDAEPSGNSQEADKESSKTEPGSRKRKGSGSRDKEVGSNTKDAGKGEVEQNTGYSNIQADVVCKKPGDNDPVNELTWNAAGIGLNSTGATSGETLHPSILKNILYHEHTRLVTFKTWPKRHLVDVRKMAEVGFYFLGYSDVVKCAFCDGEVRDWQEMDDPAIIHFTHLSHVCAFIRGEDFGKNVPIAGIQPQLTLSSPGSSYTTPPSGPVSSAGMTGGSGSAVVKTTQAQRKSFADLSTRENTYGDWPGGARPSFKEMAEAGFYYLGIEDRVRCFSCGGRLNNWEPTDDPWWEHARWFGRNNCRHLQEKKGRRYIMEVIEETEPQEKTVNLRPGGVQAFSGGVPTFNRERKTVPVQASDVAKRPRRGDK